VWTKYEGNPVLDVGAPGEWDSDYDWIMPGSLIKDGGIYNMWYSAFKLNTNSRDIGYATSSDGISWTKHNAAVLVSGYRPSVILENGTYKMWFTTSSISYAESADGISWTTQSIVLGGNARYPCVLKDGDTYKMWYTDITGINDIKYASSPDGTNWDTIDSPYFVGQGTLVLKDVDHYSMWFELDDAIHYATSSDGISWLQHGIALDFSLPVAWDDAWVGRPVVIDDDGSHKMWYAGSHETTLRQVGYATLSSDILCVPADAISQTCPNELDVGSGWLDYSILGMYTDVYEIDVASLRVLGVAAVSSSYEDVGTPEEPFVGKADENDCNDWLGDGVIDLTLQFKCREVVKAIERSRGSKVKDGDVVCLSLSGKLLDSTPITGEDYVVINKTGEKGKPDKPDKPDNPNKPPKKNASQEALSLSSGTSGVSTFQQ
jgi:hypothetical protein